mgnify:CR=1 FL=1
MNTTIKTVLENGKDFFKEIEELIYKVSGLQAELKNERRLNFLQSEDVIRYGNELQKANETIKIHLDRIRWLEKTNKTESEQLKMAKRLFSVNNGRKAWDVVGCDIQKAWMYIAEEALKGA